MTVARLREEMSQVEYVQWSMWHARKAQRSELAQKMSKHRR